MSRDWFPPVTDIDAGVVDGLKSDDVSDETKLIRARIYERPRAHAHVEEPMVPPIIHSSNYKLDSIQHFIDIFKEGGHVYSRLGNSTCDVAESIISSLEGGAGSVLFSSGSAAIGIALMTFLKAGDHLIVCHPLYSGTYNIITKYLQARYNVEVTFVGYDISEYRRALRPNTKVLYGETPCNPMQNVLDLEEFGKLGRSLNGVVTMVDSTYGTPYLQKPIKHGVDISIHSATKLLGGHSDLLAGVVTTATLEQWRDVMMAKQVYGAVLSPFEASLLIRGLRTLHVRVDRACDNAQALAEFLSTHRRVARVYYPGLPSDPEHAVAKKQMKKFGAMIAFDVKGGLEPSKSLVQAVRVIQLGVSLGGTESLIQHPASMTHGAWIMSNEERRRAGITDGLIRLSVGIENIEDLKNDLNQALESGFRAAKL